MKLFSIGRFGGAILSIPKTFDVQPRSNYQVIISHSSAVLSAKAWDRTCAQMRRAFRTVEKKHPELVEKVRLHA